MAVADDSFISEGEEEYCPLCIEEMDISDKNFKPCPCGYQICQFCYNNIRQNPELNGRCPGCRRPYDDESVEYRTISPEEYKVQQLKKEKREREKKQREKEKKETEMANKKHLAGLRVVQKNLVYVTGLNPPCAPEDLHSVLRSDKYFGQYGKILKIVINRKTPNPQVTHHHFLNPGIVVYVTFARKEDAYKCINELDGSLCDGRVLRAAHGTTKYCSSYLRGHPCPNPNCMFLHEPGEEADSFTRKDLSTQQGLKMSMMGMSKNTSGPASMNLTQSNPSGANGEAHERAPLLNGASPIAASVHLNLSKDARDAALPATAQWGRNNTSAADSPSVANNEPVSNTAAFPSLGEMTREQKLNSKKEKTKGKTIKTGKEGLFEITSPSVEEVSPLKSTEETAEILRNLSENKKNLDVHFGNLLLYSNNELIPLFAFNDNMRYSESKKPEEKKIIARQVIERFFVKPLKNYHLAYQNHPLVQQHMLIQQQIQIQQQQQQQQEKQQSVLSAGSGAVPSLSQQEQQLLLLQQLQQQLQISLRQSQLPQQLTPTNLQAQIQMIKMRERNNNTATPPPPGLFASSNASRGSVSRGGTPQHEYVQPRHSSQNLIHAQAQLQHRGSQSSSSQLLNQLMSGST